VSCSKKRGGGNHFCGPWQHLDGAGEKRRASVVPITWALCAIGLKRGILPGLEYGREERNGRRKSGCVIEPIN